MTEAGELPRVWYLVRDFDRGRDFYKRRVSKYRQMLKELEEKYGVTHEEIKKTMKQIREGEDEAARLGQALDEESAAIERLTDMLGQLASR